MKENPSERPPERNTIEFSLQKNVPVGIRLNGKTRFVVTVGAWAFGFKKTDRLWILTVAQFEHKEVGGKKTGQFRTRIEDMKLPEGSEIAFEGSEGILAYLDDAVFPDEVFTISFKNDDVMVTLQCDWRSKLIFSKNP